MVMNYTIFDTNLHMIHHYRRINSAKSVVNTAPPKSYLARHKFVSANASLTCTPKFLSAQVSSRSSSNYDIRSKRIHKCFRNEIPKGRSLSVPTRTHNRRTDNALASNSKVTKIICNKPDSSKQTNEQVNKNVNDNKNIDRKIDKKPVPTPRLSKTQKEQLISEYEYFQFSLRITEDILRNNLYSQKEMQRVFNSHIEANRSRLNMKKMLLQLDHLCKELNICEKPSHHFKVKCSCKKEQANIESKSSLLRKIINGQHEITDNEIQQLNENELQDVISAILNSNELCLEHEEILSNEQNEKIVLQCENGSCISRFSPDDTTTSLSCSGKIQTLIEDETNSLIKELTNQFQNNSNKTVKDNLEVSSNKTEVPVDKTLNQKLMEDICSCSKYATDKEEINEILRTSLEKLSKTKNNEEIIKIDDDIVKKDNESSLNNEHNFEPSISKLSNDISESIKENLNNEEIIKNSTNISENILFEKSSNESANNNEEITVLENLNNESSLNEKIMKNSSNLSDNILYEKSLNIAKRFSAGEENIAKTSDRKMNETLDTPDSSVKTILSSKPSKEDIEKANLNEKPSTEFKSHSGQSLETLTTEYDLPSNNIDTDTYKKIILNTSNEDFTQIKHDVNQISDNKSQQISNKDVDEHNIKEHIIEKKSNDKQETLTSSVDKIMTQSSLNSFSEYLKKFNIENLKLGIDMGTQTSFTIEKTQFLKPTLIEPFKRDSFCSGKCYTEEMIDDTHHTCIPECSKICNVPKVESCQKIQNKLCRKVEQTDHTNVLEYCIVAKVENRKCNCSMNLHSEKNQNNSATQTDFISTIKQVTNDNMNVLYQVDKPTNITKCRKQNSKSINIDEDRKYVINESIQYRNTNYSQYVLLQPCNKKNVNFPQNLVNKKDNFVSSEYSGQIQKKYQKTDTVTNENGIDYPHYVLLQPTDTKYVNFPRNLIHKDDVLVQSGYSGQVQEKYRKPNTILPVNNNKRIIMENLDKYEQKNMYACHEGVYDTKSLDEYRYDRYHPKYGKSLYYPTVSTQTIESYKIPLYRENTQISEGEIDHSDVDSTESDLFKYYQ